MRDSEMVNEQGRVVPVENPQGQDIGQRKRAASRSPGLSPPARRGFGGRQ